MSNQFVSILMGSDSDLPTMQASIDVLKNLQVDYEVYRNHNASPSNTKKIHKSVISLFNNPENETNRFHDNYDCGNP